MGYNMQNFRIMSKQSKQKTQISRQVEIAKLQKRVAVKKRVSGVLVKVFAVVMIGGMLLSTASTLLSSLAIR